PSTQPGVFADTGSGAAPVALPGGAAPGSTTYLNAGTGVDADGTDILFRASFSPSGSGLVRDASGVQSSLVLQGDATPAAVGGTFGDFNAVAADPGFAAGNLAFWVTIVGGSASDGIFLDVGGTRTALALRNQVVPGGGGTATYQTLTSAIDVNDAGDTAFI